MKRQAILCSIFAVIVALTFAACDQPTSAGDTPIITYTAEQTGGVDGITTSTGIVFYFSESIDELNLTAADITVGGNAGQGSATLTGAGTSWALTPIAVSAAGIATVAIVKGGIETGTKNITVYKQGESVPVTLTVTWHLNGGAFAAGSNPRTSIDSGNTLARPSPDPTKSGNTFVGWYADSALTQSYSFNSPVTANLNLYAKWETVEDPAHTHNWGGWTEIAYPGTEERVCGTNQSHKEHRVTGTEWFTFDAITTDSYRVSGYTGTAGEVYIPVSHRPNTDRPWFSVTEIGGEFSASSITVHIPASITGVNNTFFGGNNLTGITVDANNPNYASQNGILYNKAKTSFVHIPQAISGNVTIPAGVTSLPNGSYYNGGVFYGCTSLATVTFEAGSQLATIGNNAFQNCTSLASITIPTGVTSIGNNVFQNCTSLATVTFATGSQLQSIGEGAFRNCTSLTSITISEGVTSIDTNVFQNCTSLANIIIDTDKITTSSSRNWGHIFPAGNFSVTFKKNVGNYAFSSCTRLTSVTFTEGVTTIGNYAFRNCTNLTSITIPAGVTRIANDAFYNCTNLTSVTFQGNVSNSIYYPLSGNLRDVYDGPGTYTTTAPVSASSEWTKQP